MAGSSALTAEQSAEMLKRTGLVYVRIQDNFPVANRKQRRAAAKQRRRGK